MVVKGYKRYSVLNFHRNTIKCMPNVPHKKQSGIELNRWENPHKIYTSVIFIKKIDKLQLYLLQLNSMGCVRVTIVYGGKLPDIYRLLQILEQHVEYYELIISNPIDIDFDRLSFTNKCGLFVICRYATNAVYKALDVSSYVVTTTESADYFFQYSWNSKTSMRINFPLYREAQDYNTYYNRKIFIDVNGFVSNSWKGKKYGVLSIELLRDLVEDKVFTSLWHVNKDKIDVCKDCEFRYVCTDPRLPKQRENGEWYYESECPYNPYLGKWVGERGYRTLKEYSPSAFAQRGSLSEEPVKNKASGSRKRRTC